ncbi:SPOR domain-containing protein [Methyloceanibacter sp.]|uniref:SPOR domain-containing protein n=1 Tax=Methyloceanibacter sp. TaxID=1965321 RepID=UPI003D6C8316
MAVKDRRSGGRNWVPGLFAAFWILLAVFSAAYLFRIVTEPRSQTADSAAANPAPPSATSPEPPAPPASPSSLSADQAEALIQASDAKDREIGELKTVVQNLSGQVIELSNRLKPLEKVLGPVAALPSSTAVTTSPPAPDGMRAAERPPEPPRPSVAVAPPSPPPVESKPASQPKPTESVAEAPDEVGPGPKPSADDQDHKSTPSPVTADEPPSESTETANLTPPSTAPSIPPGTTRFGIEIGSVGKQDDVRPMWKSLLTNHAALVAGLQARRVMAPDKKWRLIAGPFSSAAEAMQACGLFKKADMPCEATVFAGDAF